MTTQRTRTCSGRKRTASGKVLSAVAVMLAVSLGAAPPISADSATLAAAVNAARGTSCSPLKSDPLVEQAAADINESHNKWTDTVARAAPVTESTPLLRDLGYGGSKSTILVGAGSNDANSIKALLLQGYRDIPDCSYVAYGVSSSHNASKDMIFNVVVLAG